MKNTIVGVAFLTVWVTACTRTDPKEVLETYIKAQIAQDYATVYKMTQQDRLRPVIEDWRKIKNESDDVTDREIYLNILKRQPEKILGYRVIRASKVNDKRISYIVQLRQKDHQQSGVVKVTTAYDLRREGGEWRVYFYRTGTR